MFSQGVYYLPLQIGMTTHFTHKLIFLWILGVVSLSNWSEDNLRYMCWL